MPSTVQIVLDAKDNASAPIGKASRALISMEDALTQLAIAEKNAFVQDLAEKHFANMTNAQKMALIQNAKYKESVDESAKANKTFVESARDFGLAIQSWMQIAQQAYRAAQAVYSFARAGAELEFTEIKFNRLLATIGSTSDVMLDKLRTATRGTMSDMELIASATDTLSLGLVRNERDVVRLSTVMAGLGMDMNQVVLALSNQTTMRFDQLGVSVYGFDERLKALKETGMDANAAFTEAFLQQAEEQLQKVGHAADTSAGQFMQMEAEFKNLSDSMKRSAMEAVLPIVKSFNESTNAANEYYDVVLSVADGLGLTARELLGVEGAGMVSMMQRGAAATEFYSQRIQDATTAQGQYTEAVAMTAEQIDAMTQANQGYLDLLGSITEELQKYEDKETGLQTKHAELIAKKQELIAQGWGPESEKITEINAKLSENEMAMQANAEAAELAGRRRILSMLEQQLAIDGLDARETEYLLTLGLQWGVYSQQAVDAARAAQAEVAELTRLLDMTPEEKTIHLIVKAQIDKNVSNFMNASPELLASAYAEGTGGWRTVPAGYPNDSYPILMSSGERFAVVPRGESPAGFASGTGDMIKSAPTIVINVHSPVTVMDERNAIENLRKYVGQAFRQLKSEGAV